MRLISLKSHDEKKLGNVEQNLGNVGKPVTRDETISLDGMFVEYKPGGKDTHIRLPCDQPKVRVSTVSGNRRQKTDYS